MQAIKTQIQHCCAHTESLALQTVRWIQVVRSFKAEELELRRYSEAVTRMQTLRRRGEVYGIVYGFTRRVRRWMGGDVYSRLSVRGPRRFQVEPLLSPLPFFRWSIW